MAGDGVSNFSRHIDRDTETGESPDVNQIQLNPYVTRQATRAYDAGKGIVTQSWRSVRQRVRNDRRAIKHLPHATSGPSDTRYREIRALGNTPRGRLRGTGSADAS